MTHRAIEFVGSVAAVCTTLCWIPQGVKIMREKRTEGISVLAQSVYTLGIGLWAWYGFLVSSWPILIANVITVFFGLAILILKLRYSSKGVQEIAAGRADK